MSDIEDNTTINEEINESIEVDEQLPDGEPTKSLQKPKKPRTEAQKEALKRAQIKRAENIEKRKKEKELAKLEKQQEKINKKKASINPSNNGFNEDISTEDLIKQHEEQLKKLALSHSNTSLKNINKKPKQKKPVKKTIIYESESSETEEEEIIIKKKPRHKKKNKPKKKVGVTVSSRLYTCVLVFNHLHIIIIHLSIHLLLYICNAHTIVLAQV